jgi:hypothetical protein
LVPQKELVHRFEIDLTDAVGLPGDCPLGGGTMDPYLTLSRVLWFMHPRQVTELSEFAFMLVVSPLGDLPEIATHRDPPTVS